MTSNKLPPFHRIQKKSQQTLAWEEEYLRQPQGLEKL